MLKAYINYPNPHVTAHFDPGCGNIQAQRKMGQRYIRVNIKTLSQELERFRNKGYLFAANPERNDMWLEINLADREFELAVLDYICCLLGTHYVPFEGVKSAIH
jgi:hypothetical protein